MNLWFELFIGLWIILPAYFANGLAPIPKGKRRMDFGRKFLGSDLLGGGKTWEGFIFGIFSGTLFGVVEIFLYPYLNSVAVSHGFQLPELSFLSVFLVAFGAMFGDMVGSFIKRRIGIKRGESAPLLDQLDFVFGAFFFVFFILKMSAVSMLLVMTLTPFIHLIACMIGYEIGVKKVPW